MKLPDLHSKALREGVQKALFWVECGRLEDAATLLDHCGGVLRTFLAAKQISASADNQPNTKPGADDPAMKEP